MGKDKGKRGQVQSGKQKNTPSYGRLIVVVVDAVDCFPCFQSTKEGGREGKGIERPLPCVRRPAHIYSLSCFWGEVAASHLMGGVTGPPVRVCSLLLFLARTRRRVTAERRGKEGEQQKCNNNNEHAHTTRITKKKKNGDQERPSSCRARGSLAESKGIPWKSEGEGVLSVCTPLLCSLSIGVRCPLLVLQITR